MGQNVGLNQAQMDFLRLLSHFNAEEQVKDLNISWGQTPRYTAAANYLPKSLRSRPTSTRSSSTTWA